MTKALFRLFILFITCSTAISCSEQDSPDLPDNPGNTNQGIASIDQTQINANGGGFIIRVKADGTWQASSSETWCTLSRASGNGNGSISGYMKANTGAERSVIITIILIAISNNLFVILFSSVRDELIHISRTQSWNFNPPCISRRFFRVWIRI